MASQLAYCIILSLELIVSDYPIRHLAARLSLRQYVTPPAKAKIRYLSNIMRDSGKPRQTTHRTRRPAWKYLGILAP
ncbi:hypothetical protein TRAPUB_11397 [Trametes pubescens]|uniref:Uncharacterized protein n=1 Tax=Trametes pubescens TaxID=154538 RepID=A0A1M2VWS0_TRAPU|nr:hypothetical protein TRAPUB_11397 [Trametes pubescens]